MRTLFTWSLVLFVLFLSFSADSFCLSPDPEFVAREHADSLVREDDPANLSASRAIRVTARNEKLPRLSVATARGPLASAAAAKKGPPGSTANTRQFRLFTVLRV
jgi:hypothetical protein